VARLVIAVSTIRAFGAGVLTGIAFDRNDELRLGFNAPHGVDQIASVLRTQFETELATEFAGAKPGFVAGGTEEGEVCFNELGGEGVNIRAHFGNDDKQTFVGELFNYTIGNAEVCARN
jgi:hypothetical protein